MKLLTTAPTARTTTKNRLQQQLGEWKDTHSESGRWLSYQDANKKFYARETHEDKEWKIFERTKGKTQLTCVDTIEDYQPTKYSTPVRIHTTAGGGTYKELGAELEITAVDENAPIGAPESFKRLLEEQPRWISDLTKFVSFAADDSKYNCMDITIDDVLRAHDKDGHLVAVSDGSVRNTHEMSFGWVLATANGKHLAQSYGRCDGRGSSLRAEAVGMLSISLFIALMVKHKKRTNIKGVYTSDNLHLINASKEHKKFERPYPNNTLSYKFDITEQIF